MIQQVLFIVVTIVAFGWAIKQFGRIRSNIKLGAPETISGDTGTRWKNVLLVAFGQQKMFAQWKPALLHFFIYSAFLLTQVELIEILIDGFTGQHRMFAPLLGGFYTFVISFIEILSLLALIATVVFILRRTIFKRDRFNKPEMKGWPSKDGLLILAGEVVLIAAIFTMNGTDILLQELDPEHFPDTGNLAVSSILGPALFGSLSQNTLVILERVGWWLHLLTVYAFLNYLPISKHLHIALAFPNAYFSRLRPRGEMENMPDIMNEVKSMMGLIEEEEPPEGEELPEFGAKDVFDLSWKTLLDAYSCTECGRCTAACPANLTGKKLSPRKVMMDIRDRLEVVSTTRASQSAEQKAAPYDDGKSLFDSITPEELHACTACQACVEACPVLINPLEPILAMRRYEVLTESSGPSDWIPMFNSIENSGAVWQVGDARDAWTKD
ncbi:MAG: (Fe-S)-binding protein [Rhodothermaceae bacterium]|nr:(Fe-S)-binding protein [Rhodothermaceae bacterium]